MAETVESPLLTVPFEALKRAAKDKKGSMDEVTSIVRLLEGQNTANMTAAEQLKVLNKMTLRLQHLKSRLDENNQEEEADAIRCQARIQHLQKLGAPAKDGVINWNRKRLDRLLVDHLLHSGYYNAAELLTSESNIKDLVDLHVFAGAQKVEFIELVRESKMMQAIKYARGHLAPWATVYLQDLQRAMAVLAFKADTQCGPYKHLFEEHQWQSLIELFYQELYRLNNLTPQSVLAVHLQAGISALKPPIVSSSARKEDPLALEQFQKLAEGLPYSKHIHSTLICPVTLDVMNEDNPPMVAPSGAVYSEKALSQISAQHNGMFKDPETGDMCEMDEMKRAYFS
ncbi:MAG: macrophage erythroblast attacher-like [Trebouxia sp. A1-2]|nr:MAG: macrophage erythroblast attacher-like [Trebouxia sp. A1-2]